MVRDKQSPGAPPESVISIIAPGTRLTGDLETDGTIRVEGEVQGTIRAGKAVVVGKDGLVDGDIDTQDAVISGRVVGTLLAESRLELQATCRIEGTVWARRMQLEEGAILNGTVDMGEKRPPPPKSEAKAGKPESAPAQSAPAGQGEGAASPEGAEAPTPPEGVPAGAPNPS